MRQVDATDNAVLLAPENDAENDTLGELLGYFNQQKNLMAYRTEATPGTPNDEYDRVVLSKKCEGNCSEPAPSPLADLGRRAIRYLGELAACFAIGVGLGILLEYLQAALKPLFREL